MEVSYNLRYQKSSFSNKVLLDKEGEIIIYTKGFRLKGKGATDKGELINFSEIKEFYSRNDKILFITFTKEKYALMDAGTLFDDLLRDMYKSRNEFLMDALFMKKGKLRAEFDVDFQRISKFAKPINKGRAKIKLYEKSMVIVPDSADAFSVHFDFVSFHEFDEMEYNLKIVMDDGMTIFISKLGNDYELFQERMNELLGGMYEYLVNVVFKEAFCEFHAATLLKLAYKMKGGKAVSLKDIQKIDMELAEKVDSFIFENDVFIEKTKMLKDMTDEYGLFYGIAPDPTVDKGYIKWCMFAIPEKNLVAFSILPRWKEGANELEKEVKSDPHDTFFYKIIMEKGSPAEKVEDKIGEIDQSLITLNFVKDPCYKNKRDLKYSPYQYAIRKLPFLRILRKSFVGKASHSEVKEWQNQVKEIFSNATLK